LKTVMPTESKITRKDLSHARILDAASRAIRRAGHSGVGVADVMKEAGLTHGGFYAHFPSRDDMVAAAIGYAGVQGQENLRASMTRLQQRGASDFRSLVDSYLSPQHMANIETGCVVAALGSEMPRQAEVVCQAARERVAALIRLVETVLPDSERREDATHIVSAMVGAIQMARVLGGAKGKALLAATRQVLLNQYDRDPKPR
jgi:AcrR family transcriptional regulator